MIRTEEDSKVVDINFFKAGQSYLMGCVSDADDKRRQIDVFSIEDRTLLYQNNDLSLNPKHLMFSCSTNKMIIQTEENKVFELSLNYNIRYFE